ncbi:MAG: hypothetical protein ABII97_01555 [Patescibacteria group bacterium]
MNPNNTSFIPKTSPQRNYASAGDMGTGVGFFVKLGIFLFVLSALFFGGSYVYEKIVIQQIEDLSVSLERAKAAFDPALVSEIEKITRSIPIAKDLLDKHRIPSKVLDVLEDLTMKDVGFTSFNYAYEIPGGTDTRNISNLPFAPEGAISMSPDAKYTAKIEGEAKNYTVLAQQSLVLESSDKIEDFTFSDFVLTQEGNVSFSLNIVFNYE